MGGKLLWHPSGVECAPHVMEIHKNDKVKMMVDGGLMHRGVCTVQEEWAFRHPPHDLDIQVSKLKLLKANHLSQKYALEDRLLKYFPQQIKSTKERIAGYEKDLALYKQQSELEHAVESSEESKFAGMSVKGIYYTEKAKAGAAILEACKQMTSPEPQELGSYMGFPMLFSFDSFNKQYQITLRGSMSHTVTLGTDIYGNITRLNNILAEIPKKLEYCKEQLKTLHQQMETARQQVDVPFEKEESCKQSLHGLQAEYFTQYG